MPSGTPEMDADSELAPGSEMLTVLLSALPTTPVMAAAVITGPAVAIFVNQVILLEPGILGAEEGVAATTINAQLAALSAKLP